MGMFVYKMFEPGLICRGYQFKEGINVCDHATCRANGFHAAENPLDCLAYYPNFRKSECWLCYADGDIHEDGTDSKISCTKLEILRRLDIYDFVFAAVEYIINHPKREISHLVFRDYGEADQNGFVIVLGKDPIAKGNRDGDILAFLIQDESGKIISFSKIGCSPEGMKPPTFHNKGKWYNHKGIEVQGP